ncbi:beta-galactoside alpha-2,6-sialyltransferase 1 [Astyanax mexicanus]|uniref:beta-galactoside alpha-2,6-sialyltransferase 1 n=1 Tax=Astyanax mexicanus TaxID=7994 RepID=UPI0020CAA216|nr:beta-galactoside alpha-2,6-sialyltransferase 1 [Astyanax mexicanus]XP_007252403.3 beta-galactoside alpha-2,6-sialyltransferase 1 [Astyanax mexicanus]XP_049318859.1 beta-galactoside alpha-2,6-sialyltransferase 1 [Astyanax mexicanus]
MSRSPQQTLKTFFYIFIFVIILLLTFYATSPRLPLSTKRLTLPWPLRMTPRLHSFLQEPFQIPNEVKYSIKMYKKGNQFKVPQRTNKSTNSSLAELMCTLKNRVHLSTVKAGDGPFSGEKWERSLPKQSLQETLGNPKTCAVVTSAGALRGSSLGKDIDSHDAVIRFNSAPMKGYERDVGKKTTVRIVNSQLVVSEKKKFFQDPRYRTGVLIIWDPAPYSRDLDEWYKHHDYNFHEHYHEYRKVHPEQPFYIISPSMQWDLWDVIQENSPVDIQPNPPSSGMLGIIVMMSVCKHISVYEFVPSQRKTELCHYYSSDRNWQCTQGHYHPLLFEKSLVQRLNRGEEEDILELGKVTLDGYSQYTCPDTMQSENSL